MVHSSHLFYDFNRADFESINNFILFFNWRYTVSRIDVNSAASGIQDALHTLVLRHVLCAKFSTFKFPTWFSNELINVVFQKIKAHAIYKNFPNLDNYRKFSFLRAKYKYMTKQFYRSFI